MSALVPLIILLLPSVWTVLIFRSAVVSLHNAGKTRGEIENIKTGFSFIQRLFLLNIKDAAAGTPKYNVYRHNIEKFLFGYLIAVFVLWILVIISIAAKGIISFVTVLTVIKLLLVDLICVGVYLKFNTVFNKSTKRLNWKWTVKNK